MVPGCLGYIGEEILPIYMQIIISQYKNPSPTGIQKVRGFLFVAEVICNSPLKTYQTLKDQYKNPNLNTKNINVKQKKVGSNHHFQPLLG